LYNGLGQRTAKLTLLGISVYHYDVFGRLISETTLGSQPSRDYVWAEGVPVAQINHWLPVGNMLQLCHCTPGSDAQIDWVTYLHTDGLGTPRIGTDPAQNVVWRWDGDAFGQTLPIQSVPSGAFPVYVNLRNPGQYFDQETGFFYNRARYYNPQDGRYISSDPIGLAGGLNTFAYALGNPIRGTDPLGLAFNPFDPGEALLGELFEAIHTGGVEVAGSILGAATVVAAGIGLGYEIDNYCQTCEQFGESVGGQIYQAANPYNPSNPSTGSNSSCQ
jgi:RHS repeat-associated protein